MAEKTKWQEPSQLAQGDTISFTRKIWQYRATDGWSLLYALRGNGQNIEFTSTPSGDDHVILVAAATTETWLPAEYMLEGFAVNAGTGERHQIYLNQLPITPDLSTAAADVDTRTFCQKALANIEAALLALSNNSLQRTSVEQTEIDRVRRLDLMQQRNMLLQERKGEIAAENARNGRPTGRKIQTVLNITSPGCFRGFGPGSVFDSRIG